jgi:predicted Rossmann fold nucleotide-binding protein DprA/Smf involved in DNA uptake
MEKLQVVRITLEDSEYPVRLRERLGDDAPSVLATIGAVGLLNQLLLALLCSVRCPGSAILEAYETAKKVARSQWVVVSGFHSPMEKECLRILLRAKHPVVLCVARSLDTMGIPAEWREHIQASRMLLLSPFAKAHRRNTTKMAEVRNQVVVALAEKAWIPYAAPGGKTRVLASKVARWSVNVDKGSGLFTSDELQTRLLIDGFTRKGLPLA